MADAVTKSCPVCFGTIDARAKKCPHCHSPQGIYKFTIPFGIVVAILSLIGICTLLSWAAGPHGRQKRIDRASDAKVVSSKQYFAPATGNGVFPLLIASLSNESDHMITGLTYEVRFYNKQDELIDVIEGSNYGLFEPHKEFVVKATASTSAHLPESDYASHKIIIQRAYEDE
jgi:hypothetical protein